LSKDAEQLRTLTFGSVVNRQDEAVEFLDLEGNLVFSMRHKLGGLEEEYQFVKSGDNSFTQLDFVRKALVSKPEDPIDKYPGLAQVDKSNYFYIAGPAYASNGQRAGTIIVGLSLNSLASQLQKATLAQATLYNADGLILASTFPVPQVLDSTQVAQVLVNQDTSSYRRELSSNRRSIDVLNIGYDELLGPWEVRNQEDIGILGVSLFRNILVNPSLPTRLQIIVLVAMVFVLIILIGYSIANAVSRPLVRLMTASQEVSHGNLAVQLPPPAMNDELSDLTSSFNQMVSNLSKARAELEEAYDSTLLGWALALEMREKETAEHGKRVTDWTMHLASELGVKEEDMVHIRRGAMLHDIGKMGVPDRILLKPGPLTDEEFAVMRLHPVYAWNLLSQIEYLRPALTIPYSHHEHWDGTGYPRGLKGEEIPIEARIFAVADVWDAVTRDRVYRKALSREESLALIQKERNHYFDPRVVDLFLRMLPDIDPGVQPMVPQLVDTVV
jgi:putative nucleotidyltransferase with HDIG domain